MLSFALVDAGRRVIGKSNSPMLPPIVMMLPDDDDDGVGVVGLSVTNVLHGSSSFDTLEDGALVVVVVVVLVPIVVVVVVDLFTPFNGRVFCMITRRVLDGDWVVEVVVVVELGLGLVVLVPRSVTRVNPTNVLGLYFVINGKLVVVVVVDVVIVVVVVGVVVGRNPLVLVILSLFFNFHIAKLINADGR